MRDLLRALAAEGRAVLVSSHLMSELEDTADHVVVIGRGRLIADAPVAELVAAASDASVTVRTPDTGAAMRALAGAGAVVTSPDPGVLSVVGLAAEEVAELMAGHRLRLYELTPHRATLEEAYMGLTRDAVEFGARS